MEIDTSRNDVNMNDMDETRVIFSRKGQGHAHTNGYTSADLDSVPREWEQDNYTDDEEEEEEVFMEGLSKTSRPLMHPRNRTKVNSRTPASPCRRRVKTIVCFLVLVISLSCFMALILYMYNKKQEAIVFRNKPENAIPQTVPSNEQVIVGSDVIEIEDVWVKGFPKLITESSIRLLDVNTDGVLDIILGFGTGADGYYLPNIVCDIYFGGSNPCFGGLLALDGATGTELWRHYSPHEMFGVNCNEDLNQDGVADCLAGGRANAFQAVSGKDGRLLWNFAYENDADEIMNLYTPQFIRDIDGDHVPDILAVHGGDPLQPPGSKYRLSARIMLFSGRTGSVLRRMSVPDYHESYYSPQLYTLPDGTDMVLYGTGGETHPGSLWVISLNHLLQGNIDKSKAIYTDEHKGVMTPPVLIDLTGDGVEDIVMAMFNSTVVAINGASYQYLWNTSFPLSESYNTPAAGYYDDDDVPDFMVKYAHGPGFPIYYNSQTTILNGQTGKPLLQEPVVDTIGAQSSPLTISMEGFGNDVFLYWVSDCTFHDEKGFSYEFVKGTNVHAQSRADFCKLRFKSRGYSKMYAISQHMKTPGQTVYDSMKRSQVEHSAWINTTVEALDFIQLHPELYQDYLDYREETIKAEMESPETKLKTGESFNPLHVDTQNDVHFLSGHSSLSPKKGPNIQRKTFPSSRRERLKIQEANSQYDPGYQALGGVLKNILGEDYDQDMENQNDLYQRQSFNNPYPNYHPVSSPKHNVIKKEFMKKRRIKRKEFRSYAKRKIKPNQSNKDWIFKNKFIKENKSYSKDNNSSTRKKRHVGPHDEEGLQRLLSTGTLAPPTLPLDHKDYNNSIDIVFATYWFFPAKTQVILKEDRDCIENKMKGEEVRFSPTSKYYGMDHDKFEHVITEECLNVHHDHHENDHIYQSQTSFNPYDLHMGQMTVYRLRIKFKCSGVNESDPSSRCSRVLPFSQQQWSSYMGKYGDSHWIPKQNPQLKL